MIKNLQLYTSNILHSLRKLKVAVAYTSAMLYDLSRLKGIFVYTLVLVSNS